MNEYPFTSLVTLALVGLGLLLTGRVSKARLSFSESDQPSVAQHSVKIYSDPHFMAVSYTHLTLPTILLV